MNSCEHSCWLATHGRMTACVAVCLPRVHTVAAISERCENRGAWDFYVQTKSLLSIFTVPDRWSVRSILLSCVDSPPTECCMWLCGWMTQLHAVAASYPRPVVAVSCDASFDGIKRSPQCHNRRLVSHLYPKVIR